MMIEATHTQCSTMHWRSRTTFFFVLSFDGVAGRSEKILLGTVPMPVEFELLRIARNAIAMV